MSASAADAAAPVKTTSSKEKVLARAVKNKDPKGVTEALDAGADVNWINPITSIAPLHLAVKHNDLAITRLLLERGADPNAQTKAGWTSMHFAVKRDKERKEKQGVFHSQIQVNQGAHELAELLRDFGGRADVVNEWLRCPSDIAKVRTSRFCCLFLSFSFQDKKDEVMIEILKKKAGPLVDPTTLRKVERVSVDNNNNNIRTVASSSAIDGVPALSFAEKKNSASELPDDDVLSPRQGGASTEALHKQLIRAVRFKIIFECMFNFFFRFEQTMCAA